jgi:hypothetical protein
MEAERAGTFESGKTGTDRLDVLDLDSLGQVMQLEHVAKIQSIEESLSQTLVHSLNFVTDEELSQMLNMNRTQLQTILNPAQWRRAIATKGSGTTSFRLATERWLLLGVSARVMDPMQRLVKRERTMVHALFPFTTVQTQWLPAVAEGHERCNHASIGMLLWLVEIIRQWRLLT